MRSWPAARWRSGPQCPVRGPCRLRTGPRAVGNSSDLNGSLRAGPHGRPATDFGARHDPAGCHGHGGVAVRPLGRQLPEVGRPGAVSWDRKVPAGSWGGGLRPRDGRQYVPVTAQFQQANVRGYVGSVASAAEAHTCQRTSNADRCPPPVRAGKKKTSSHRGIRTSFERPRNLGTLHRFNVASSKRLWSGYVTLLALVRGIKEAEAQLAKQHIYVCTAES